MVRQFGMGERHPHIEYGGKNDMNENKKEQQRHRERGWAMKE